MKVKYLFGYFYDSVGESYLIQNLIWPEVFTFCKNKSDIKRFCENVTTTMLEYYRDNNMIPPQNEVDDIERINCLASLFALNTAKDYLDSEDGYPEEYIDTMDGSIKISSVQNDVNQHIHVHCSIDVGVIPIWFDLESCSVVDNF